MLGRRPRTPASPPRSRRRRDDRCRRSCGSCRCPAAPVRCWRSREPRCTRSKLRAQLGAGVRVGEDLVDGLARVHHRQLPAARLHQVGVPQPPASALQAPAARSAGPRPMRRAPRRILGYHAHMQVYLVGGAVRDALLGRAVRERDWVVVGADARRAAERAGLPAGRPRFPGVPASRRRTRNMRWRAASARPGPATAASPRSFSPDVTLEEDLRRRDLTINAMAQARGRRDHRSLRRPGGPGGARCCATCRRRSARIRCASCASRASRRALRELGFQRRAETRALMRHMVAAGEVAALVPERVWQETERALGEPHPQVYFEVLRDCGALAVIFPEIDALYGVPQPPQLASGDRHRRARACCRCSARPQLDAPTTGALRGADARPGQGHDAAASSGPSTPRARGSAGVPLIEALCDAPARAQRPRELARPDAHATTPLCIARWSLRPATVLKLLEELRRAPPPGALRRVAARLRGRRARPHRAGGRTLSAGGPPARRAGGERGGDPDSRGPAGSRGSCDR